jgi:hypothetical protein
MNDEQEAVEALIERVVGQTIVEAGIDNDEFFLVTEDNTRIVLFSDEDLQLYYELPDATH